MELYVAEALKQIGEPFSFEASEPVEPLTYGGRRIVFDAPLMVRGTYAFDGKGFSLEGQAETVLQSVCARCNHPFSEPFSFRFSEHFAKNPENDTEDGEDFYPYAGDRLEILQAVMDNLLLQLPMISVCKPDCKGLCPVCGADRNVTDCNCQPNETPGPFSSLASLTNEE